LDFSSWCVAVKIKNFVSLGSALVLLAGCVDANKIALERGAPLRTPVPEIRSVQTTGVACRDQVQALQASNAALQDIGMIIAVTSADAGVITGSKQRDATEAGQVIGAVVLGVLFGANAMQYDVSQNIRATVVVEEPAQGDCRVRIAFERIITNNEELTRSEYILDPQIYLQFFEKLRAGAA
jgi:hypothetical protein